MYLFHHVNIIADDRGNLNDDLSSPDQGEDRTQLPSGGYRVSSALEGDRRADPSGLKGVLVGVIPYIANSEGGLLGSIS
jgi:hypothetical protein